MDNPAGLPTRLSTGRRLPTSSTGPHHHVVSNYPISTRNDEEPRRLGQLEMRCYASRAYRAARGEPREGEAFEGHDLVMYQQPVVPSMWTALCGEPTSRGRVVFQTSSTAMLFEAAIAGIGIAELPSFRADSEPELVRIMPHRCNRFDAWLVAHADLYKTARMQALISAVVEEFATAV
jgi:DNA-binding transcriptional LysR family regulator